MKRLPHLIVAVLFGTPFLFAGENVLLRNGFSLHADRHEAAGDMVKLYVGSGVTELPASSVSGFEPEPVREVPVVTEVPKADAETAPRETAALTTPADLAAIAAKKYLIPESFVRSVMKAESGFQANAVSPKGAIGLMQLMPETARKLGVDPHDPGQNAEGGAQYLRELLVRYENDPNQVVLALAAYNAGPEAVDRYHGVPPYPETRAYIVRVLKNWQDSQKK